MGSRKKEKRGRVHVCEGEIQRPVVISGCIKVATRFIHSTIFIEHLLCAKKLDWELWTHR